MKELFVSTARPIRTISFADKSETYPEWVAVAVTFRQRA